MLKTEIKKCRKCSKPYLWTSGGIVATSKEFINSGICDSCTTKDYMKSIKTIFDIF